jgi:hypothetical protein
MTDIGAILLVLSGGRNPRVCENERVASSYDRSRELGDCCGFCLRCGWGRRFMAGGAAAVPAECPDCGGAVITACPECGESIASLMALTCRACGAELRGPQAFGGDIRRKPERHKRVDAGASSRDNESTAVEL